MAEATGISWADATFNPWVGCEKVSPGCAHCYAETLVTGRMGRPGTWGPDGTRERTSPGLWKNPLRWNRLAVEGLLPNGGENPDGHRPRVFCASLADVFEPRPELVPWRLELFSLIEETPNLDWLLLTKRPEEARDWLREFYLSYGNEPFEDIETGNVEVEVEVFESTQMPLGTVFAARSWTSRDGLGWGCLPNLWVGVSVENARFTWRVDVLREIPAAVRFLSCEPLVGSLFPSPGRGRLTEVASEVEALAAPSGTTLRPAATPDPVLDPGLGRVPAGTSRKPDSRTRDAAVTPPGGARTEGLAPSESDRPGRAPVAHDATEGLPGARGRAPLDLTGIDWVIVGGESGGRNARPMHPGWTREIREAVIDAAVPELHSDPALARPWDGQRPALHFKQWGSWTPDEFGHDPNGVWVNVDGSYAGTLALDAYPAAVRDGAMRMRYAGPAAKAGGKLLDGVEWCEFPEPLDALTPA